MRKFGVIVIFMLFIIAVFGNDFRYLRTQEGLNDGRINTIVQDSTGNIWIGTYSGLTKYDGTNLKEFRPEIGNTKSLPTKKIRKLFIDSEDNLWISSTRHLCLFDKRKELFYMVHFKGNNQMPMNILNILEYKKNILIHTIEDFYIIHLPHIANTNLVAHKIDIVAPDKFKGRVTYSKSTEDKLFLVGEDQHEKSEVFNVSYAVNAQDTLLKLELITKLNKRINSLEYVPEKATLYFATSNGVIPFSTKQGTFGSESFFKGKDIQQVEYTENNKLFGSISGPVLLYHDLHSGAEGQHVVNPNLEGSLLNNEILTLFEDFSGNLWIGHQGQGISILNLFPKGFITYRRDPLVQNSLSSSVITCFSETKDEIFVGSRNNGLDVINKEDLLNRIQKFDHINISDRSNSLGFGVWNIARQSEQTYWLATEQGLFKMEKVNNNWKVTSFDGRPEINDLIWKLLIDSNGNIWCGTFDNGLILIPNPDRNPQMDYYSFQNEYNDSTSLSDNYVKELIIDSKNRFWIGTLNGLNCLVGDYQDLDLSGSKRPELKFKRYFAESDNNNGLNNNEINGLKESIDGNLWISTNGGGINILSTETNQFRHITIDDGLPSDDVYGMMQDEFGNMWVSTLRGLVSINQLVDDPVISVYDQYDGVQGEVFVVGSNYKSSDGILLFGGNNGFTCFNPSNIAINDIKPKVAFGDLYFQNQKIGVGDTIGNGYVLNNSLNYTDEIVLPFEKSFFRIKVSTLHFQAPLKNKFTYTLEGYMSRWSTKNADEEVVFANLPFGEYTLKAKAVSSDYVESEDTKVLHIKIQPPWYKQWYAIMIFILLVLTVIIGFLYILINRQKLLYQKQINEIAITNNENKMMFLTNIAHEIRTPLSLIIAPIEDLIQNVSKEDGKWREHLQLIHRNSSYLLKLTNQIIDFRKLNAGKAKLKLERADIVRVIKDVVLNFRGFENKKNIKLYLNTPVEKVNVLIDVQKIEEVLYNLLSNAFKNTLENHSITVSMILIDSNNAKAGDKGLLRISVFNEGKELSEEDRAKVFERFYKLNENAEGAGIGLSFSKSLVELHNGTIKAESIQGKGVVFHIDLPAADVEMSVKADEKLHFEENLIRLPMSGNGNHTIENVSVDNLTKVMIVEDNTELREFLTTMLSRNFQCFVATDGEEGWEIIKREMPSVVISDVIMPNVNGYELCQLIKKTNETCHIPVLLLTAKNSEKNQIEGYQHGADAFITKPFDTGVLITQINRLIKNRELIREKYITSNFMVEIRSNQPKDREFVQKVRKLLEDNITDPDFNVAKISGKLNISTTQLYRRMKQLTGHSPVEFIRVVKLQKAYGLLSQNDTTVKEVCFLIGFNSLSYFIKCFKDQFGITPATFRDKGLVNAETN